MLLDSRRAVMSLAGLALFTAAAATTARAEPAAAGALTPLPPQAADVAWPTTAWPVGPLPAGVSGGQIDAALAVVAKPQPHLGETRAVVIIHRGVLVAERYMTGYGPDTPLLSWSMAKSVTHALLGIAVRRGLIDIDKPMGNPHWQAGDARAQIPWRNWINMIDGQDYHEIGVSDQTRSDAAKMLYGPGRLDVAAYSASLPLSHPPATHWNYNSAGINLIADALGRVLAPGTTGADRRAKLSAVMKAELFSPIGMTSAQPEFDAAGTFVGSAFVYATARDWARFGLLYLRDGVWQGNRILPEHWVDFARTKTPVDDCDVYGAGFWVTPVSGGGKPHRALIQTGPRDVFVAQGHEGQLVVIVPSKDLVVVRLGHLADLSGWQPLGAWVAQLVQLFPDVRA